MINYINWDFIVQINKDGTKIREWEWKPVYPESLDLKITNYCDKWCVYCHEQSNKQWSHWDIDLAMSVLMDTQIKGIEIAIGWGNPLSHPRLLRFLEFLKENWFISNITVNSLHLREYGDLIDSLIDKKLIYWLWISYDEKYINEINKYLSYSNTVLHFISGWNTIQQIEDLYLKNNSIKVLILWFKNYWNWKLFFKKLKNRIDEFKNELPKLVRKKWLTLAFDNLSIKQLEVRRFFTTNEWNSFYMGDDWRFTMFIDLVNKEYCKSSTHNARFDLKWNLKNIFSKVNSTK